MTFPMKQFLFILIIISLLCSNLAWAWDNHSETLTGHVPDESSVIVVDDVHVPDDSDQHDHYCCHGVSHLTAIPMLDMSLSSNQLVKPAFIYQNILVSFIPALPNKPPRV